LKRENPGTLKKNATFGGGKAAVPTDAQNYNKEALSSKRRAERLRHDVKGEGIASLMECDVGRVLQSTLTFNIGREKEGSQASSGEGEGESSFSFRVGR